MPELRVTQYDQVSSWLIALVAGLGASVFILTVAWISIQPHTVRQAIPVEIVEMPGGVEDGSLTETLKLENDGPETELATLAEEESDVPEVMETLGNVTDLATEATDRAERQFETENRVVTGSDARNAGIKGSAHGTGKRALGFGSGKGGIPREQRWYVSYNDRETLEEYGKQLDFFKIELGTLTPDGRLIYLSQLSAARPVSRAVTSGKEESRLYMTWQGGARKKADLQLFQKAGVDVGQGIMMQFYPPDMEKLLGKLELDYKKRPLKEIRRTYFSTRPVGNGYEFYVTQQAYFK